MLQMNRQEWANTFYEQPNRYQKQEMKHPHDFFIQSHTGILYGRNSGTVRRLYSTA